MGKKSFELKNSKGITLIALVITIIVLLILAGISIAMLTGDNGILNKATTAGDKSKKATAIEEVELAAVDVKMKYYIDNEGKSIKEFIIKNLNNYETGNGTIKCDENGKVIYTSSNEIITGSINDEGDLEIDKEGIVIMPRNVILKLEEGVEAPTVNLTASLIGIEGEVTWTNSNLDVAKLETNGKTAKITGLKIGTATVSAKCGEYETSCEVMVKGEIKEEEVIGDYVEYNVTYTDMYSDYEFKETDGWRILGVQKNKENTEKYDIKIVSTGIPAILYYHYIVEPVESWQGTTNEVNKEYNFKIENWSTAYSGFYSAYGLLYKFEDIFLNYNTHLRYNTGYYKKINGKEGTEVGLYGNEFKASGYNEIKVHNMSLAEINKVIGLGETDTTGRTEYDETGIAHLSNLNQYGYPEKAGSWAYYLSTAVSNDGRYLYFIWNGGSLNTQDGSPLGLRPVISIFEVELTQDTTTGVWKIN